MNTKQVNNKPEIPAGLDKLVYIPEKVAAKKKRGKGGRCNSRQDTYRLYGPCKQHPENK
jgi:hypothetical protein